MIRSMTGFGAGHAEQGGEEVDVEVRAVNHKYCEVKARLPRELSALELEVVRTVKDRLARGGIEVAERRSAARGALAPRVDLQLAKEYARAFEQVRAELGLPGAVTRGEVLDAEGVVSLQERDADVEAARGAVAQALDAALGHLRAMREREGQALAKDLSRTARHLQPVGFPVKREDDFSHWALWAPLT